MGRPYVSADAIVGFDHHSDEFNLNEREVNADLRSRCPVAWNEKYGGFWYVSSYDAVEQVARDGDTFAHKYEPNAADGVNYQGEMGVPRPEGQPPLGIGEVDGPYHLALRRALTPFFSSGAIEKMRPFMEQSVHWFLDQRIADGRMDLVLDYASPVPAILTMRLMGLPYDNWQLYATLFHSVMDASDGDAYNKAIAEVPAMIDGLLKFAATRRADPADDLTSFLGRFEFDGKRLDDNQLIDILWNLIGGGVDTTTSLTALSLLHLGTHRDLRQQLIDRPELYQTAGDEYLRYCSVNKTLSRTVSRDTVLGGQQLRRNDQVLISWFAANHDEREFERADEVVLDRAPNRHVAFGLGPHRCIGAPLARVMFQVMVKAVLERMPDYVVELDGVHQYSGNPSMTGLGKLPVTFTPGVPLGTSGPPDLEERELLAGQRGVGELFDVGAADDPVEESHEIGVGDQRDAELVGLITLAVLGVGVVADHQRRLGVDCVGVGQPRVRDPLDELFVRAVHLGRQRHPHALHQRAARDKPAGVQIRARQSRGQHLQRAQLLVGDLAVGPLPPRHRPQR